MIEIVRLNRKLSLICNVRIVDGIVYRVIIPYKPIIELLTDEEIGQYLGGN